MFSELGAAAAAVEVAKGVEKVKTVANGIENINRLGQGVFDLGNTAKQLGESEAGQKAKKVFSESVKKCMDGIGKNREFTSLKDMKRELGKKYSEIIMYKPLNSPDISKWFDHGGKITVNKDLSVWHYTDTDGREVVYRHDRIIFPEEAKHPTIKDIRIEQFTGSRVEDKKLYLKELKEEYGLNEIPRGYDLHHDYKNGKLQLIKSDWHKEFTHCGGFSKFKED